MLLASPVLPDEVKLIGPHLGVNNSAGLVAAVDEAADAFERRRLARATSADDAIEVGAEADDLLIEKTTVERDPNHARHRLRDLVLNAYPRLGILESDAQRREARDVHLVTRDALRADGVAAEQAQVVRVG